jgi:hypothetical protein
MGDGERYPAGDLLQMAATISGIAIALATFTHDRLLALLFLFAGLLALAGGAYAMSVLWIEAGLGWRHLVPRRRHEDLAERYEALLFTAYGLMALTVAYVVLLLRRLP